MSVPKLRFPEFRDAGEWEEKKLGEIASPVSEKSKGKDKEIALTLSAEYGIVSQGDYFGKRIAGENVDRYIKISLNDFVYNDRITKSSTYGTIKRLSQYTSGLVSPIYKCFRFKDSENPVFWEWYFESGNHEIPLQQLVNEGARAGRFNISIQKFLSIAVYSPESSEQQKIADCLSSLDDRITTEAQKLDTLKAHKKGLMQQLFPAEGETLPKLRFPEFRDSGDWEEKYLGEIIEVASGQVDPTEPPYCDLPHIGGENIESHTGNLHAVKTARELRLVSGKYLFNEGDVLYSKIRPALNKVAIPNFKGICSADIYPLRPSDDKLCRRYLAYLLLSETFLEYATKHSDRSKIPKINRDSLLAYKVVIPHRPEQQRIADCLTSLEDLIAAQSQAIDLLKLHKKGLMQQLFPSVEEVKR